MNTFNRILVCVAVVLLYKIPASPAASVTWDGGDAGSSDWTAPGNWAGDTAPATDGTADLLFAGTNSLNPNANLDWSIHALTFSDGAGGFLIQGNTLTIGAGGIVNNDDSVQTIGNNIVLAAPQTFSTTSTGSFAVNGDINTAGKALTVDAATDFIVLGGAITGSGSVTSRGFNSLVLTGEGNNTYTGGTIVSGSLILGKTGGATAIPGALTIGGGAGGSHVGIGFDEQIADTSAVTVNAGGSLGLGAGVIETVGALTVADGFVRIDTGWLKAGSVGMTGGTLSGVNNGRLILGGNVTATGSALGPAVITGRLDLGAATRTFLVTDAAGPVQLDVQAAIFNGNVVKTGDGTLWLSGTQSYSTLLAQAGTVDLETPLGTGSSTVTVAPTDGTATVNFEVTQKIASLTIGDGGIATIGGDSILETHVLPPGDALGNPAEAEAALAPISAIEDSDLRSGASQSVPEPGALGLLLVASGLLARRRRS